MYCKNCEKKFVKLIEPETKKEFVVKVLTKKRKQKNCCDNTKIGYFNELVSVISQKIKNEERLELGDDRIQFFPNGPENDKFLHLAKFKNFDFVLQQRFYQISSPIIRQKLWFASKQTSELGNRPTVLVSSYLAGLPGILRVVYKLEEFPTLEIQNLVIDLRKTVMIENLKSTDFKSISKFVNFKHDQFSLVKSSLDSQESTLICNPNVSKVVIDKSTFDFQLALNFLPNLMELEILDEMENGWEKEILNWNTRKLKRLKIKARAITDYETLELFVRSLPKSGKIVILNTPEYNEELFLKSFAPYDPENGEPCLILEKKPYVLHPKGSSCWLIVAAVIAGFLFLMIISGNLQISGQNKKP